MELITQKKFLLDQKHLNTLFQHLKTSMEVRTLSPTLFLHYFPTSCFWIDLIFLGEKLVGNIQSLSFIYSKQLLSNFGKSPPPTHFPPALLPPFGLVIQDRGGELLSGNITCQFCDFVILKNFWLF